MTLIGEIVLVAVLGVAFGWLVSTLAAGRRLERLRGSQDALQAEVSSKEAQIVTLSGRLQQLESKANEVAAQRSKFEAVVALKDREIAAARDEASAASTRYAAESNKHAARLLDFEQSQAHALTAKSKEAAAWEARATELAPKAAWLAEEAQIQLARIEVLERRTARLEESEREAQQALQEARTRLQEAGRDCAELSDDLTAATTNHDLLRDQLHAKIEEIGRLNEFVAALEPLSAQLAEAERELTTAVEAKNAEIERLNNHVRQLEATLATSMQQSSGESVGSNLLELRAALQAKDHEVARLSSQARGLEEAMKTAVSQRDSDIARLTRKVQDLESALRSSSSGPAVATAEAMPPAVRAQKEISRFLKTQPVEFNDGTASLSPGGYKTLDELAGLLRQFDGLPLEVSSHTDSTGDFWQNYQLSTWRATAVRDYLAYRGVPESGMTALGCGSTRPVDTNDTQAGRQANRRVEVRVRTEALDV